MCFTITNFHLVIAASSNPSGFLVLIGLIVLAIVAATCYIKGNDAGFKAGSESAKNAFRDEKECFNKVRDSFEKEKRCLSPYLSAISTFRRTVEWAKAWQIGVDPKTLDRYKQEATKILDAVFCDLSVGEYKQSLQALESLLQSREHEYKDWLSKEMENAKSNLRIEALQQARDELSIDVAKLIDSAVAKHPDNYYIASSLTLVKEAVIERLTNEILSRYGWTASSTATKAINAITKKFNETAKQWHNEALYYKCQTELYESLFPQLLEYSTIENEDKGAVGALESRNSERDWLTKEEYATLSHREKSQLALDRYITSSKTKWQVGRDFELFVGYKFRRDGWQVEQFGVERKLEDMGRDLICRRSRQDQTGKFTENLFGDVVQILVVQCKFWSSDKIIHEKHIAQLFGTTVEYAIRLGWPYIDNSGHLTDCMRPVFVTSASLSETAKRFAEALAVEIKEGWSFDPSNAKSFPRIKCNQGKDGERIYHLPFDQQYDVTRIDSANPEECWAFTVEEAESKGYRRAKKWIGD